MTADSPVDLMRALRLSIEDARARRALATKQRAEKSGSGFDDIHCVLPKDHDGDCETAADQARKSADVPPSSVPVLPGVQRSEQ